MNQEKQISGLSKLGEFITNFLKKNPENFEKNDTELHAILSKSQIENPWFTIENQKFALNQWANLLNEESLKNWLKNYSAVKTSKRVGLILAGNIPLVGWHDIISTILSNHIPVIKLSSKDRLLIPFLLKVWNELSENEVNYEIVDKLKNFDAVIATGSNNTARHLDYYFKDCLNIIRRNRTSVAVLKGDETDAELQLLAEDIFRYFGMGCRNVTRLFIPNDFKLDRLFENFLNFKEIINHNKYANNYDYHRAIFLLNLEKFWDNNFVMIREEESLFPPLSVINFTRYNDLEEVKTFLDKSKEDIQCIVAKPELGLNAENFGEAQNPGLATYADNVDTMRFLEVI